MSWALARPRYWHGSRRAAQLGRYRLRMWSKHGDASLLSLPAGAAVDEDFFTKVRALYERGYPSLTSLVESIQTLEREHYGRELEPELLAHLRDRVRAMMSIPLARGIVQELSGFDPEPVLRRGPTAGMLTSVIVVSHESLDQTRRCLERLRAAARPEFPMQLLFVDNGSTDGTPEYLAEQPDLTLIRNAENFGAPRARNQALALAHGEAIAFLDSDAMVEPEWLEPLLFHLEVDPFCACVGPRSDRAAHGAQIILPCEPSDENLAAFARETAT